MKICNFDVTDSTFNKFVAYEKKEEKGQKKILRTPWC